MTTPGSGAHDIYEIATGLQRIRDDIGELPVESQYFAGTPAVFREGKPQLLGVGHTVKASPDLGIDKYDIHIDGYTMNEGEAHEGGDLVIHFSANTVIGNHTNIYKSIGTITLGTSTVYEGVMLNSWEGDLQKDEKEKVRYPNLTVPRLAAPLGSWLVETVEQQTVYWEKREKAEEALRNALEDEVITVEDYEKEYQRIRTWVSYFPTTADIAPLYDFVTDSQSKPFAMDRVNNGIKHLGYELTPIPTPLTQHK